MGKGDKKDKKKGGKRKGKKKEPPLNPQEVVLAYQINIIEKKIEDYNYDIRGWEEKNRRHEERNLKLKEEQDSLFKLLRKMSKEDREMYLAEEIVTKDDVIEALKLMWKHKRKSQKEMEERKREIAQTMVEVDRANAELENWNQVRDTGLNNLDLQIKVLQQEIRDMHTSFDEMSAHIRETLVKTKAEIEEHRDGILAQQKGKASDKALLTLHKHDRQEIIDNAWLKNEVKIQGIETGKVQERVADLEKMNLEIMAKLFDHTVDDLKISREFFLTQFTEGENIERAGLLEMDLAQLSPLHTETTVSASASQIKTEPKTDLKKALSATLALFQEAEEKVPGESHDSDDDDGGIQLEIEDYDDYLHVGPLELKLLSLTGKKKPLHIQSRPSSTEMALKDYKPDQWPISFEMLKRCRRGIFPPIKPVNNYFNPLLPPLKSLPHTPNNMDTFSLWTEPNSSTISRASLQVKVSPLPEVSQNPSQTLPSIVKSVSQQLDVPAISSPALN